MDRRSSDTKPANLLWPLECSSINLQLKTLFNYYYIQFNLGTWIDLVEYGRNLPLLGTLFAFQLSSFSACIQLFTFRGVGTNILTERLHQSFPFVLELALVPPRSIRQVAKSGLYRDHCLLTGIFHTNRSTTFKHIQRSSFHHSMDQDLAFYEMPLCISHSYPSNTLRQTKHVSIYVHIQPLLKII